MVISLISISFAKFCQLYHLDKSIILWLNLPLFGLFNLNFTFYLNWDNAMTSKPVIHMEALGQSESFLSFQEHLSRVAPIERPVLILGERGTGKELAATRLHFLSLRWQGPFIALNCAALTPSLIESELFGHEKGAFTGAQQRRSGRFESADGGTLFLDEIGALPLEVQEKILRVVEYGVFERVGSTEPIEVDVRIIGATNENLPLLSRQGRFKQDLLDRLSFDILTLPPLRERKGDILLLADHFARQMAYELGRSDVPKFTGKAKKELQAFFWSGNIRELKNVVERAVYRSQSKRIDDIIFDPFKSPYETGDAPSTLSAIEQVGTWTLPDLLRMPLKKAVFELERKMVEDAIHSAKHNQRKAAGLLGLSYDQFRGLKRKYTIPSL
jgi:psp operon transcriptional activator